MLPEEYRTADACGADEGWTARTATAVGHPLVVSGSERDAWDADLFGVRWRFLWRRWVERRRPCAGDWERLLVAAKALHAALIPFTRQGEDQEPLLPSGWASHNEPSQDWIFAVMALRFAAEHGYEKAAKGGRPLICAAALATVRSLLRSYRVGFARQPSAFGGGPTERFVAAFFCDLGGEWTEVSHDGSLPFTAFDADPPRAATVRTMIDRAISLNATEGEPSEEPPVYSARFSRPQHKDQERG